jgi:hypothetical protein
MAGSSVAAYSYAGNNPVNASDPDGNVRVVGDCKNVPSDYAALKDTANKITDSCLKNCVLNQLGSDPNTGAYLQCDAPDNPLRVKYCKGVVGGFTNTGGTSCDNPGTTAHWCDRNWNKFCIEDLLIHELAHSCGWQHKDGKGVPGAGSGYVLTCAGQR